METTNAPALPGSSETARRDDSILIAARAFASSKTSGALYRVVEFGVPSVGPDGVETHYVSVEGEEMSFLTRVTVEPEGIISVDYLTAS